VGVIGDGASFSSSSSNPVARSDGVLARPHRYAKALRAGVLEYCAKSELHPRSGLGMLEGRCIRRYSSSGFRRLEVVSRVRQVNGRDARDPALV